VSWLLKKKNYQWMAPIYSIALQWKRNKPGKHFQNSALQCFFYLFCFRSNPLHRIEFGPPKFFSKTFRFAIIFYSTLPIFGGGHFRKACRSRKKESKQSEITCKQSEPARTIFTNEFNLNSKQCNPVSNPSADTNNRNLLELFFF